MYENPLSYLIKKSIDKAKENYVCHLRDKTVYTTNEGNCKNGALVLKCINIGAK